MAPVTQRRFANLDDDDFDDTLYDRRYYPKRVFKDGCGPRVRLMMTDAAPGPRRPLFDARHHQPHFADLTDARLQDGLKQAAEARDAWIGGLQDAWKTPTGGAGGAPVTTAPGADEPDEMTPP